MKLNEFKSLVLDRITTENKGVGRSAIKNAAIKIYKENYAVSRFATVQFGTRYIRRTDKVYWNLHLKMNSDHPSYCPWLSNMVFSCVQPLYTCSFEYGKVVLTLCDCDESEEISDIVTRMEDAIIERVKKFEESIRLLDEITDHYGLQTSDITRYMNAVHYAARHSKYNETFFLDGENRRMFFSE